MNQSNGGGDPAERAIRKMSHKRLRAMAEQGNRLAQRILREMSKDAGKKATKAIKKAKRDKK